MDLKKAKALSDIQRALGLIEGASCSVENASAGELIDAAVKMIENAVEELTE
jgi:hypothetical protein